MTLGSERVNNLTGITQQIEKKDVSDICPLEQLLCLQSLPYDCQSPSVLCPLCVIWSQESRNKSATLSLLDRDTLVAPVCEDGDNLARGDFLEEVALLPGTSCGLSSPPTP